MNRASRPREPASPPGRIPPGASPPGDPEPIPIGGASRSGPPGGPARRAQHGEHEPRTQEGPTLRGEVRGPRVGGARAGYWPSTQAKTSGATIVASLSMMNLGVSMPSLPHVIFSFGTAPEYEPYDVVESLIWQK